MAPPRDPHLALGANEAAHVLHHTNNRQLHLVAEAYLFPDILEGHLLAKFTEQLSHSHRALEDTCGPGDGRDTGHTIECWGM